MVVTKLLANKYETISKQVLLALQCLATLFSRCFVTSNPKERALWGTALESLQ